MAAGGFGIGSILEGKKGDDDDYFKILGCSESSTDEQIIAEYRVRALQCHPDKHPGNKKALEQFQKLQEAKETLLDPEKRQKYNRWKSCEMCIPYKQWLGMMNKCTTTMHWAKPKDQTMIESFSDHRRKLAEQTLIADVGYSPGQPVAPEASSSSSTSRSIPSTSAQQQEDLVWRPDNTTSIYSKFRNYQI